MLEPTPPAEDRNPLGLASTPKTEVSHLAEARKPQGMFPKPPISSRGESSSSSSPFWNSGFERERGSCSGLLESTPLEAGVTPLGAGVMSNPLAMMLRDGSTVFLNETLRLDLEKDGKK